MYYFCNTLWGQKTIINESDNSANEHRMGKTI
ncbi:unknown [Prevotella sp. CAG:592]|nr:unknown [Prevotella sp. CAG:592]